MCSCFHKEESLEAVNSNTSSSWRSDGALYVWIACFALTFFVGDRVMSKAPEAFSTVQVLLIICLGVAAYRRPFRVSRNVLVLGIVGSLALGALATYIVYRFV
jgi:hypothetical protein